MTDQFVGKRSGLLWKELYLAAENIDLLAAEAWNFGGLPALDAMLDRSDVCEHGLTRLAAEVSYLMTGDAIMRDEMLSCRPPGAAHLVPDSELIRARDLSKQQYLQQQRVKYNPRAKDGEGSSDDGTRSMRRNRRPRAKGKGDGGKGGGGAAPSK